MIGLTLLIQEHTSALDERMHHSMLLIYIVQEILTFTVKHAVSTELTNQMYTVEARDNQSLLQASISNHDSRQSQIENYGAAR